MAERPTCPKCKTTRNLKASGATTATWNFRKGRWKPVQAVHVDALNDAWCASCGWQGEVGDLNHD